VRNIQKRCEEGGCLHEKEQQWFCCIDCAVHGIDRLCGRSKEVYSVSGQVVDSNGVGIPDVKLNFSGGLGVAVTDIIRKVYKL
jgi:hypothetical protein